MTASTPAIAKRLPPEARRRSILDAAASIALTEGIEAITNRNVASRLGCAQGLVHHYFPVADELAAEAFRVAMTTDQDDTFDRAMAGATPLEQLARLFDLWVSADATPHGLLWLDAWSLARRKPLIRQTVDELMGAGHRRVRDVIVAGRDAGVFRVDDVDAFVWTFLTTLDGVIVHSSLRLSDAVTDTKSVVARLVEHELGLADGALAAP